MAHAPSTTDYDVPLDGVGTFRIARRTMGDHLKINVEYSKITEGVTPAQSFDVLATCIAVIRVLVVRAPDGWNVDELDPLEPTAFRNILDLHSLISEKEGSFRQKPAQGSQAAGQGPVRDPGVVVPAEVQPAGN